MRTVLAALILPFALASCGLASIDVPINGKATIEADPTNTSVKGFDLSIDKMTEIDIQEQKAFKKSGFTMDDVKSLELRSLKVKSVDGEPLDFIDDTIQFFVESTDLEKKLVASGKVAPGDTSLTLETFKVGLHEYAKSPMTFSAKVDRKGPETDREIEVKAVVHIDLL
ncbi:MAG TPA: hypothetical protein VGD74_05900 [Vulgatibacter sp.]